MAETINTIAKAPVNIEKLQKFPLLRGCKIERSQDAGRGKLTTTRNDGLQIYFDDGNSEEERIVNSLRITAEKEVVCAAIALLRGKQVFISSARKAGLGAKNGFSAFFSQALRGLQNHENLQKAPKALKSPKTTKAGVSAKKRTK